MCVLMSTHTLTAAEEIANRVGIMNHGQLAVRRHGRASCASDFRSEKQSLESMYLSLTEDNQHAGAGHRSDRAPARCDPKCNDDGHGAEPVGGAVASLASGCAGAAHARIAKRSCCGDCGTASRGRDLRQLLTTARLRTVSGRRAEPVLLDRPVPAVLRGLQIHRRQRRRSRARRITHRRCSSCFICSLRR